MKALFSGLSARFFSERSDAVFCCLTFLAISLFVPIHPAMAEGTTATLGAVFCNVAKNMTPFLDVFNWLAYTSSAVLIMQGVFHLAQHHEHPNNHPHHKTFALLLAGILLSVLPSVIDTLSQTILFDTGTGGGEISACSSASGPTAVAASAGNKGLDGMMARFVNDIGDPLTGLVSVVAVVLGVFLVLRGLFKASRYGVDPREHSVSRILTNLVIGSILIATSQSVDIIMGSVFGTTDIMEFGNVKWTSLKDLGGDTQQFQNAIHAALDFFQLVGLISFVRGWNIIRNAVENVGQVTFAQGLTHIIGGVLAMNIYAFMQIMDATFGTSFVS